MLKVKQAFIHAKKPRISGAFLQVVGITSINSIVNVEEPKKDNEYKYAKGIC